MRHIGVRAIAVQRKCLVVKQCPLWGNCRESLCFSESAVICRVCVKYEINSEDEEKLYQTSFKQKLDDVLLLVKSKGHEIPC